MNMLSNDYQTAAARCMDEPDYRKMEEEQQLVDSQLKNHREQLLSLQEQLKDFEAYFKALETYGNANSDIPRPTATMCRFMLRNSS